MNKISIFSAPGISLLILSALTLQIKAQTARQECGLRKPNNGIFVVAHRGAHEVIPENSLPAYQKAIDLGCDFVEIDIRTTKDGKFVSVHNSKLDKYASGAKGKVQDYTLKQLKTFDIGKKKGSEWKGTRIPTFDEILDLCKGKIGIYLDLKKAPVPELVAIIRKYGMEKDIIWYIPSGDEKNIEDLRTSCPECLLMPDPGVEPNIQPVAEKYKPCVIATDMERMTESFVSSAHAQKAAVITDEKEGTTAEWQKIIDWKADGIQTDKPAELISFLKSKK